MKLDVFVRVTQAELEDPLRRAMLEVTVARWKMEPVAIRFLHDYGIREGREYAERIAGSDPYIYTDSDVLIVGKNWVERGMEAMLANPEYAVCSTLSLVEGENQLKPPDDCVGIYDCFSVGAPMWIRKGVLVDLPEMDLNMECGRIYEYVQSKGRKEGLITGIRHNHLGHGFSGTSSMRWGV